MVYDVSTYEAFHNGTPDGEATEVVYALVDLDHYAEAVSEISSEQKDVHWTTSLEIDQHVVAQIASKVDGTVSSPSVT